jgi:hypothetical protein
MLDANIQNQITLNDCIIFKNCNTSNEIGMVMSEKLDEVDALIFKSLSSEVSQQYSLSPVTATQHPMAHHGNIVEVLACLQDTVSIPRNSIEDIVCRFS